jgi:predicted Zn-dependent peptidase
MKINNTPIILNNKDFKTIQIKVIFPYKDNINDLALSQLLPSMLNYMNNSYPTEELFQVTKKKLYILGTNVAKTVIGTDLFFSFNMIIPDTLALNNNMLEEQIKFFREIIYNPLVTNNNFNSFELDREITNLRMSIDNLYKNIRPYHSIRLREEIDDIGIFSRDIIRHMDLIDKVNTSNLYEYYLKVIKNNKPIIFIMGNVDNKEISDLCSKYLIINKDRHKDINFNHYNYLKPRELHEVVEKSKFNDSILSFVYKVDNMSKDDEVLLNTIRDLLSSLSSRLLSKKLRDENNLIYSSKVVSYPNYGVFEVTVYINNSNYLKVKDMLFEVMNDLKNEEITSNLLNNIKERKRINLYRKLDNKYLIFDDFIYNYLGLDITMEEYYKKICLITSSDISNFIDRLKLDTIYYLKEGVNE